MPTSDFEKAVIDAGYVPETGEGWVKFEVEDEYFVIDYRLQPLIYVLHVYSVDTNDWDMSILRQAAHLMADQKIMVKATIHEIEGETSLHFFIVVMDRNYPSFRDNLKAYIKIINDGDRRLNEIYNRLIEEKKESMEKADPFMLSDYQKNKLPS